MKLLALSVILGSPKATASLCGFFRVWNADDETCEEWLYPNQHGDYCVHDWKFNIEVIPCNEAESAHIILKGPIESDRKENIQPFMAFGHQPDDGYIYCQDCKKCPYEGILNGREYKLGRYEIEAVFYPKDNLKGTPSRAIKTTFDVDDCRN